VGTKSSENSFELQAEESGTVRSKTQNGGERRRAPTHGEKKVKEEKSLEF